MPDNNLKVIKKIDPTICPHCGKDILVSFQSMLPSLTSVLTQDDIANAKESVKKRLEEIKFENPDTKQDLIKWLDEDGTLIDMSDVEPLIHQISVEELEKIQAKTNKDSDEKQNKD